MCIIYAEIDIVILSDALFLSLLVGPDLFNLPRTKMERKETKCVVYLSPSGNWQADLHSLHITWLQWGQWTIELLQKSHSCSQLLSPSDTDLFILGNLCSIKAWVKSLSIQNSLLVEIKVGFISRIDVNFIISVSRVYYSYVDNEFYPFMVHERWFSISSILFSNISYPFFCKWQIGLLSTKQASTVFTSEALHKCCLSASARLVEDRWVAGWSPRELRHLWIDK